jgi:hypothetical protein
LTRWFMQRCDRRVVSVVRLVRNGNVTVFSFASLCNTLAWSRQN